VSALAGLWRLDGKPGAEADCASMLAAQHIYGPHDENYWSDGPLAMGRRLFRLLPEDVRDRQPLHSRDGRLTLVADVRLDNRDELIALLGLSPADARQLCDAAILLESLERWEQGALDRLVGEFAFVLWDAKAQTLFLARDFLGQRPLHYHRGRGFFAFASMPKGLHALAEVPYAPDEESVAELVTLMPQWGPRSFFKDISRVEAAHVVTVTRGGLSSRRYWNPQRPKPGRTPTGDYVEGLRHYLDLATRSRLRGANGVVGTQLSAGFDSSAVTATAARLLAPSGGKVVAFTAVPPDGYDGAARKNRFGDEGPLAAATAAMYPNIEHVLVRSDSRSPLEGIDRAFYLFERPSLSLSNAVWGWAINQSARDRKLNIMLSGGNGNMSLSYHGLELLPELLRSGRLFTLWREAAQLVAKTDMRWRGALARTFGGYVPVWLWQWANQAVGRHKQDVLDYTAIRAERLAEFDLPALARERNLDFNYRPRQDGFATRLWVMARIDSGNAYKGTLGGWGIDYRDPTADKRLVEYCLSIPTEQYLQNGVPRALAKRALADRLPQAVLNERKRGYQAADWHEGVTAARVEIAAELDRLAACAPAAKTLDIERMKRLVENWPTSGWERDDVIRPYRLALLRGVAAGHFLRKASGANQ
jgi:asparagine synthase (glutamine-hydrolysing)